MAAIRRYTQRDGKRKPEHLPASRRAMAARFRLYEKLLESSNVLAVSAELGAPAPPPQGLTPMTKPLTK
jgi:hypothetical protein